jgi:hypothetical protein
MYVYVDVEDTTDGDALSRLIAASGKLALPRIRRIMTHPSIPSICTVA